MYKNKIRNIKNNKKKKICPEGKGSQPKHESMYKNKQSKMTEY